jgi:hypothetical protein
MIRRTPDGHRLSSDIDLVLVHDDLLPPMTVAEFLSRATARLPMATAFFLSGAEYRNIRTAFGQEFKGSGISLTHSRLPVHDPVVVTARDALEICIQSVFQYFVGKAAARGHSENDYAQYSLGRCSIKLLRSGGMLYGGYNSRDVVSMELDLSALMKSEYDLLDAPPTTPPSYLRFWRNFSAVLDHFDQHYARKCMDAVTDSEYEGRPSADGVRRYQTAAMSLARAVLGRIDAVADLSNDALIAVEQDAWAAVVMAGHARPFRSPEEFFQSRYATILDQMMEMKTS